MCEVGVMREVKADTVASQLLVGGGLVTAGLTPRAQLEERLCHAHAPRFSTFWEAGGEPQDPGLMPTAV